MVFCISPLSIRSCTFELPSEISTYLSPQLQTLHRNFQYHVESDCVFLKWLDFLYCLLPLNNQLRFHDHIFLAEHLAIRCIPLSFFAFIQVLKHDFDISIGFLISLVHFPFLVGRVQDLHLYRHIIFEGCRYYTQIPYQHFRNFHAFSL